MSERRPVSTFQIYIFSTSFVCMSFYFPGSKKDRLEKKKEISSFSPSLSTLHLPPRQQPAALLLYLCVIRTGNVLSSSSSYISFRRKKKKKRGERMNWSLVVACSSSRYGWPLLAKVFLQKIPKKERGVLFYIFLCVLSPPLPPFVYTHTHRENNNNNELYVFVLILK